jgi:hypothetical protein
MTDKAYLLKNLAQSGDLQYHGKFFTSPYTAMAKGARMMLEAPSFFGNARFTTELFGVDMEDVPCDHIAIQAFDVGMLNHIHRNSHKHGFVLLERSTCVYEVLLHGQSLGSVFIIFLPPVPDSMDIGEIMVRPLDAEPSAIADLALMVNQFWDNWF